jgi:hypothetical protein
VTQLYNFTGKIVAPEYHWEGLFFPPARGLTGQKQPFDNNRPALFQPIRKLTAKHAKPENPLKKAAFSRKAALVLDVFLTRACKLLTQTPVLTGILPGSAFRAGRDLGAGARTGRRFRRRNVVFGNGNVIVETVQGLMR